MREVSNTWEREAIDVRNRTPKKEPSGNSSHGGESSNKRKRSSEMEVHQITSSGNKKEDGKGVYQKYCFNCWLSNHLIADCRAPKYEELSAEEKLKRQKRTREAKKKIEEEKKKRKEPS